jgi:hypothetical protein
MPYSEPLSRLPLPKTPIHSAESLEGEHSYQKLIAGDVDEHAANLGKWDQNYDQISPGSFWGTLSEVWIGDMQIFREVTTQAVVEQGQAWAGARTVRGADGDERRRFILRSPLARRQHVSLRSGQRVLPAKPEGIRRRRHCHPGGRLSASGGVPRRSGFEAIVFG